MGKTKMDANTIKFRKNKKQKGKEKERGGPSGEKIHEN
jgi:hypothetical protein